ncbi:DUF4397 domain-containing protein [uncultured Oscillibacter sp.]|uniref:DUF4397 domain-containing protein n=2 Tax=uncultured Oscillibacter sp. TaxID=876091 RepID=UPI00262CF13F|nr:DUF4397 domain-containing protein [uncultured Oscillibacter sp.]
MTRRASSPAGRMVNADEPMIPLPNVGEGGPVYPGNTDGGVTDPGQVPVIPLPNPGEGGPVYPGDTNGGVTDPGQVPVIPLPNPGEGGPVYPGPGTSTFPYLPGFGGTITVPVTGSFGQSWNCSNNSCISAILPGVIGAVWPSAAKVRFLNAGYGYQAFRIFVGNRQFVSLLNYASATTYGQVSAGYQTVTVAGTDGYIYIQKTMPFQAGGITTIAVVNTASGLDLLQITDSCCPPTNGYSSFRVGNLAMNTSPMDVIMSDGRVVWTDLRFKEVAAFKRIMPGTYQFFYADTNLTPMPASLDIETLDSAWLGVYPPQETFGSLYLDVVSNAIYSVYLLQSGTGRNNIQNLILMDR